MKALKGKLAEKIQNDRAGNIQLTQFISGGLDRMMITLSTGEIFEITNKEIQHVTGK